jgi:hypothetical protein
MMRTLLIASLLTLGVLGASPAAADPILLGSYDCAGLSPGAPGGGVLGLTEWYAVATGYSACVSAAGIPVLPQATAAAQVAGNAASGAAALVAPNGLASAVNGYGASLLAVASSQAHDSCGAFAGDSNPTCGGDPAVSQAQSCGSGVAIPNPIGGGLGGNTLANSNGALQATCLVAGAVSAAVPSTTAVNAYLGATQAAALAFAGAAPTDLANGARDAAVGLGGAAIDNTCTWLTEHVPCF